MADLSAVIEYEKIYPVAIKLPNGDDSGIVINVISKDSRRVVDALRDFQADVWDNDAKSGKDEHTSKDRLKLIEDHGVETLIACIDSWDWGEHSFSHINGSGSASRGDREFLIKHPNARWIVEQLAGPVNALENFTHPLPKSARSGSKKT